MDVVGGAPANMPRRYTQGAEIGAVGKLWPRITLSLCKPSPLILEYVRSPVYSQHCERSLKVLAELCFSLLGRSKVNQQESLFVSKDSRDTTSHLTMDE